MSAASLTGTAVLDRLRALELLKQAIEVEQLGLIAQVEAECLAHDLGAKSTAVLLRQVLRIGARDAAERVRLAAAVTPRRTLTGEPVEAAHPQTAQALAEGAISTRHAITVVATADRISDFVADTAGPLFETQLIDCAREHDPDTLARFAHDLYTAVDQDGAFRDIETAHRRREVSLHRRPDGSGTIAGELTCEAAEYLETLFDTLGKPHQGPDGQRDPRTPGQRRHDALLGGFKILYSSGSLPTANGCATTLVLTATVDEYANGTGIAQTAHGYAIPTAVADRWLDPKAKAILVLLSKTRGIVAYSDQHRLFTEQQRLAMFARDKGCSYPGCDAPLSWTQAHHVTDYAIDETNIGRRRHTCLHRQPRHLRTHGLAIDHAQRPTPLGPARLGRPRPATATQPDARHDPTHPALKHGFQRNRTFQRGLPGLSLRSDRTEKRNSTIASTPVAALFGLSSLGSALVTRGGWDP